MSDQLPMQGPEKGTCGCGCGKFATFRKSPPPSNGVRCVRTCDSCRQCKGGRASRSGYRNQQVKGAKAIAGQHGKRDEQNDRFAFRWENKTGVRLAGAVFTAWLKVELEDQQRRPYGDARPFVARFHLPSSRYGLIVLRDDQLRETWHAIGVQNKWIDEGAA